MRKFLLFLGVVFTLNSFAESPVAAAAEDAVERAKKNLGAAQERRAKSSWVFLGAYAPFDLWVMGKYGATVGYVSSLSTTYEMEYLHGSMSAKTLNVDIASVSEDRLSLLGRSFGQRNSFSLLWGAYYNQLKIKLGSSTLSSVSGSPQADLDVLALNTIGVTFGLGNRWQTEGGFVFGCDWFVVNMPVIITKDKAAFIDATTDPSMRSKVQDAFNIFKRFPALAALKIQLGFSF